MNIINAKQIEVNELHNKWIYDNRNQLFNNYSILRLNFINYIKILFETFFKTFHVKYKNHGTISCNTVVKKINTFKSFINNEIKKFDFHFEKLDAKYVEKLVLVLKIYLPYRNFDIYETSAFSTLELCEEIKNGTLHYEQKPIIREFECITNTLIKTPQSLPHDTFNNYSILESNNNDSLFNKDYKTNNEPLVRTKQTNIKSSNYTIPAVEIEYGKKYEVNDYDNDIMYGASYSNISNSSLIEREAKKSNELDYETLILKKIPPVADINYEIDSNKEKSIKNLKRNKHALDVGLTENFFTNTTPEGKADLSNLESIVTNIKSLDDLTPHETIKVPDSFNFVNSVPESLDINNKNIELATFQNNEIIVDDQEYNNNNNSKKFKKKKSREFKVTPYTRQKHEIISADKSFLKTELSSNIMSSTGNEFIISQQPGMVSINNINDNVTIDGLNNNNNIVNNEPGIITSNLIASNIVTLNPLDNQTYRNTKRSIHDHIKFTNNKFVKPLEDDYEDDYEDDDYGPKPKRSKIISQTIPDILLKKNSIIVDKFFTN
jgi:hypothetical protein